MDITYLLNVLYAVSTLAVVALGLGIVFGLLGVLNLAHGEFVMLGAYSAWFVQSQGVSMWAAVPLALVVCAAIGWVLERWLIRPLYHRPFDTLIATWGVSLLLRKLVETVFGLGYKNVAVPLPQTVTLLGATYPAYRLLLIAFSVALIAALFLWYRRSRSGTRIQAMVDNPALAQAVGIKTQRLASATFVVGVCLAGLAGVMLAPTTPVQPFMGVDFVLDAFFALVVGGLGSVLGLVAGAGVIGGTGAVVAAVLDRSYGYFAVLGVAIGFMWLRPRGLYARS
jgi:branched-chain amino acid transport system permease protein/urea transport system permease protein